MGGLDPFSMMMGLGQMGANVGQMIQNQANFASAQAFNREEAQKNRDFQNFMSSTAYRRAKVDMEGAGLNPLNVWSSGGGGQASTPGGSSADSPSMAGNSNIMEGVAASAAEYQKMRNETNLTEQEVKNKKDEGRVIKANADRILAETDATNAQTYQTKQFNKIIEKMPLVGAGLKMLEQLGLPMMATTMLGGFLRGRGDAAESVGSGDTITHTYGPNGKLKSKVVTSNNNKNITSRRKK